MFHVLSFQILRCASLDDNPDSPRSFAALRMTMRTLSCHSELPTVILNEVKNLSPNIVTQNRKNILKQKNVAKCLNN